MTGNNRSRLKEPLQNSKTWWYAILISIALLSIGFRLLKELAYEKTALLYVGIPFMIALILVYFHKPYKGASWRRIHRNLLVDGFIIMMGSSVLLAEGFICVVIFMPIYLLILTATFAATAFYQHARQRKRNRLGMHVLPLILLISAFEGVLPGSSFNRQEQVSTTRVVEASIAEIKNNLLKPIELQKNRAWFLQLFPMPYEINAESLNPGDVHEIHLRYYRWFFTNVHEGSMRLEISEVESHRIKTTFLDDSSYFSNYLELKGTEITMKEIDERHTEIRLSIDYSRKLDPYWYFAPIGQYGVGLAAEFLLTEVIARENG